MNNDGHGAITIGSIETFISEYGFKKGLKPEFPGISTDKKVAIIGSGPAGIACATYLLRAGIKVEMYERQAKAGGLLTYGIPGFKLDKIGAESSNRARITNENAKNVFMAIDFLRNIQKKLFGESYDKNYEVKGKNVVVVGGGDTAMDCLRTALREDAKSVKCLYRRDKYNMPGSKKEFKNAKEEGAIFTYNATPKEIVVNSENEVIALEVQKTMLGKRDASGRASVEVVKGSEYRVEADVVIFALGFSPSNPDFLAENGIEVNKWGAIEVNENYETTASGVYAGGDCKRGSDLVVTAAAEGKAAAEAIIKSLLV